MLRLILIFTLSAALGAHAAEGDPRRAAALLDYVSGDYQRAISPQGAVLSADELAEQTGFIRDASRELDKLGPPGADLHARAEALLAAMTAHTPPQAFLPELLALKRELLARYRIAVLPQTAPELAKGQVLFAAACATCHGLDGMPTETGRALEPPARPFALAAEVKELSPARAFSTITYGVPGTGMPSWSDAYDDAQRWDLAYFVLSLAHKADLASTTSTLANLRAAGLTMSFKELGLASNDELATKLAKSKLSPAEQEQALALARHGPFETPGEQSLAESIERARGKFRDAAAKFTAHDPDGARALALSAYLDDFEPHEPSLRTREPELVARVEREFVALRVVLDGAQVSGANSLGAVSARLDDALELAQHQGPQGDWVAFIAALVIILREGIEAALIVAVLLSLLRKAQRTRESAAVHFGWSSALAIGVATWFISGAILALGSRRELTEGILQFVTAGLLLAASHWLLAAASAKKLVGTISKTALGGGSTTMIFLLAFGSVYREAFEVVVFFRGILSESPNAGRMIVFGALVGAAALSVIVFLMQQVEKKLSTRPMLVTFGVVLCALAVIMVGKGMHALQEAGVAPITPWGSFEVQALGVFPSREAIVTQAVVAVALIVSAVWSLRKPLSKGQPAAV
ncbi:MAG: FTR1 family protein [Deltaproteobacteria bacterium]|nr:FTR1 family protein [Deltaproteobacteria bacterium]